MVWMLENGERGESAVLELEKLKNAEKVVGTRRLLRAIAAGEVSEAYLAMDADLFIARQVREACEKAGVRLVEASSMKALGQALRRRGQDRLRWHPQVTTLLPSRVAEVYIEAGTAFCGHPQGTPKPLRRCFYTHADDQSVDPQG